MRKYPDQDQIKYRDRWLRRYFVNQYLKNLGWLVDQTKPKRILNLGCGDGYPDQYLLRKFPGTIIRGIDSDRRKVSQAKRLNPEGDYRVGDLLDYKFSTGQTDLVLCLQVLEHLKDYPRALIAIKHIGKRTVFSVPWEPWFSWQSLLALKHITRRGRHPDHFNFWSPNQIKKILQSFFPTVNIIKSFPWLFADCRQ